MWKKTVIVLIMVKEMTNMSLSLVHNAHLRADHGDGASSSSAQDTSNGEDPPSEASYSSSTYDGVNNTSHRWLFVTPRNKFLVNTATLAIWYRSCTTPADAMLVESEPEPEALATEPLPSVQQQEQH